MRRICLLSIAAISLALVLHAARRPHYGGTLRMETRRVLQTLDSRSLDQELRGLVFETLLRWDQRLRLVPLLATAWQADPARHNLTYVPRQKVILHNGATWEPDLAQFTDQPDEMALARNAIAVKTADGQLVGTGPFKIAKWNAGKSLALTWHEAYWGPRPYLDSIEVRMGRSLRDQALDFDLGQADAIEISPADVRRLRQRGAAIALTQPTTTLALVFDAAHPAPDAVREALALSIDREAIHSVILQRTGEIAGSLLPQWVSGYAFLFPVTRDLARARQLAARAEPLLFGYDRDDALLRAIAERLAVNASEAGVTLRAADSAPAQVRLVRLSITAPDAALALADLAQELNRKVGQASLPAVLRPYDLERSLLAGFRVIPLFHLPRAYELSPRVKNWPQAGSEAGTLADVWLLPERPGDHP
jgi:peptide/nickel transport system substrate-binding protein